MISHLSHFIDDFPTLTVLVIGEAMLDRYLEGTSTRLSQEAPVPIVDIRDRTDVPGGAANAAVNVRSLGAEVQFLSVVGHDLEGELLQQALIRQAVATEHLLVHPTRRTLAKHRVVANSQMLLRFDQGSTELLDADTEQAVIDRLTQLFPTCDAVLVSDYSYGILTPRVIQALTALQARSPRVLVVDSRNLGAYRTVGVTAVKPNYAEAVQLLGLPRLESDHSSQEPRTSDTRIAQIMAAGAQLIPITGARIVAVTVDADGALIFERSAPSHLHPYRTHAQPSLHSRTTGAGDTYMSALTLALAAQAPTAAAAELAAAAAAIVVAKDGTATCSHEELREMATRSTSDSAQVADAQVVPIHRVDALDLSVNYSPQRQRNAYDLRMGHG